MDEALLDAVRLVRSCLAELLRDEAEARRLDGRLADLLRAAGSGADVTEALDEALSRHGVVRAWVADVRRDPARRPPERQPGRGYVPIPGETDVPDIPRYTCPEGDYLWDRRHVGQVVPLCPTHNLRLVPVDRNQADAG